MRARARPAEGRPQSRPDRCKKCGRLKSKNGFDDRGRPRLACRRVKCRRQSTPRPSEGAAVARPWCVRCRRAMIGKGGGRLRCVGCGVTCTIDRAPRRHFVPDRPDCPDCGRPMNLTGSPAKNRFFYCQRRACIAARRQRRDAEITRLAASVAERLPRYLALEEREDATQSIILDGLAGKLAADGLTPKVLRSYAARAVGMARDRFRFVSLSEPTDDGREFGETIAA